MADPIDISAGHWVAMACQLEAAIPKAGNVHRGADFSDMSMYDLILSGQILGSVIDAYRGARVGATIRTAAQQTRLMIGKNSNLGLILLLVPLAKVWQVHRSITHAALSRLLDELTHDDSREIYDAIRLASPGGLGRSGEWDVADEPPGQILEAMRYAADRDAVARQWANGFEEVFEWFVPRLIALRAEWEQLDRAVAAAHVEWIASHGDSLICRKCGPETNEQARRLAAQALEQLPRGWDAFESAVGELDFWMRADGHRRNPGTTADLMAAALFVGLADGRLEV
ncbi:MAG TPA: triphosphoribosyl-dephospho-CoA synthase [Pirellulaceae bacterium]|nr:triphosphoribosyl-dephospho-CoA synthase [Pirellulaceae bacterium]